MKTANISVTVVVMLGLLILASASHAQERLKKIRITYPTESIAVLPLFAASRWKTFEDNDLQAEIIQAAHRSPTRRSRAVRSAISPASGRRRSTRRCEDCSHARFGLPAMRSFIFCSPVPSSQTSAISETRRSA